MKTTLEIEDSLHGRAKAEAARRRIPLTRLIEESLRRYLEGEPRKTRRPRFKVNARDLGMKPAFREMSMNKLAVQLEDEAFLEERSG